MAEFMRVRTVFTGLPGSPYLNTAYWVSAANDATSAQQAVDAMRDFWAAVASNITSGGTWTVEGDVPVLESTTGDIVRANAVTLRSGATTLSAEPLPAATQGLIRLNTTVFVGGRRILGRWFVPLPGENANVNALPSSLYISGINTALATLTSAPVPDLVVWSRKNGSFHAVSTAAVRPMWAVLRSRRD